MGNLKKFYYFNGNTVKIATEKNFYNVGWAHFTTITTKFL